MWMGIKEKASAVLKTKIGFALVWFGLVKGSATKIQYLACET
jgi:hypothetical protein